MIDDGGLLTEPDQMEVLPQIYVRTLAATAGYLTSVPEPDRGSLDLRLQAGGDYRPALDLQLKATTTFPENPGSILSFQLSIKNYRELSDRDTPRLLVILALPKERKQWISVTEQELVLRRRAYWLSLQQNYSEITDQETVTVHIPLQNMLNIKTLQDRMEKSRKGEL